VWPDATYNAYLMTVHEFNAAGNSYLGQSASAFDRAKLLAGDGSAPLVTFALGSSFGGMLAADLDGAPPASGTPGFFFMTDMTDSAGSLQIWEFKPNWTTPANSVFGVGAGHTANYSCDLDVQMLVQRLDRTQSGNAAARFSGRSPDAPRRVPAAQWRHTDGGPQSHR
jgi:hypothetical protein